MSLPSRKHIKKDKSTMKIGDAREAADEQGPTRNMPNGFNPGVESKFRACRGHSREWRSG
ncbi:hypothetical protein PSAC2689_80254 [Paraburkholderia sacchari]